jgi:hypothetical protein
MLETQRTGGFHERTVGFWVVLSIPLFVRMAILSQNWFSEKLFLRMVGMELRVLP